MRTRRSHEAYHGPDEPADAECPFCNRPAMVDGVSPETCAMCGMEIHHPDEAANMVGYMDRTLYFCCIWCLRIYQRTTMAEAHKAIEDAAFKLDRVEEQ